MLLAKRSSDLVSEEKISFLGTADETERPLSSCGSDVLLDSDILLGMDSFSPANFAALYQIRFRRSRQKNSRAPVSGCSAFANIIKYGNPGAARRRLPALKTFADALTIHAIAGRASIRGPRVRATRSARAAATAIRPDE